MKKDKAYCEDSDPYYPDKAYQEEDNGLEIVGKPGLFTSHWRWEQAGLIGALVNGVLLTISPLAVSSYSLPLPALLFGLALLGFSVHSAYKTKWLRYARQAPLLTRIEAGFCIVCGWISIVGLAIGLAIFSLWFTLLLFLLPLIILGLLLGMLFGRR